MIERFSGDQGKPFLVDALRAQRIVQGDKAIAIELSKLVRLQELQPGEVLITEDGHDNDLFFILSGLVAVKINGRQIARRRAGNQVGEMGLVDASARRSASIKAIETTVVAAISGLSFSSLADTNARLWRLVAVEISSRLRETSQLVRPVNTRPIVFVGSSTESLPVARAIQDGLEHDDVTVRLWTDNVFGASQFPIDAIEELLERADFGLLVVGRDDKVVSRDEASDAPRDNVVFELGMCIGSLGRTRSLFLKPRGIDLKIPSDLLGMGCLEYEEVGDGSGDLASAIAPACNKLRRLFRDLGCR